MPRSLMSTSGWFFSRLSSTNFFKDLDMICTKRQQQSTWATARGVQGQKRKEPQLALSGVPLALESGYQRAGYGCREDGAQQGAGKGPAPLQPLGDKQTQVQCHTHSPRRAGPDRWGVKSAGIRNDHYRGEKDAVGQTEKCTQMRNTPCPGAPRRRTWCHALSRVRPSLAPDPSQIRRTLH